MTVIAFPGHAMNRLRSSWTLPRWRSVARIGAMAVEHAATFVPRWRSVAGTLTTALLEAGR